MRELQTGTTHVREVALSPDGRFLVAGILGDGVTFWDLAENSPPRKLEVDDELSNGSFAFHSDGRLSWIDGSGRSVFDPMTEATEWTSEKSIARGSAIIAQHSLADGRSMIHQGVPERGVGLWEDEGRGKKLKRIWFLKGSFFAVSIGQRADRFFLLTERKPESPKQSLLQLRQLADRAVVAETTLPYNAVGLISAPDSSVVACFHNSNLVVWRPGDALLKFRPCARQNVRDGAFHPSGKWLAIAGNDDLVHVYDVATWTVVKQYAWNLGPLSSIAFSDDGTLATVGSDEGRIVVWDVDF